MGIRIHYHTQLARSASTAAPAILVAPAAAAAAAVIAATATSTAAAVTSRAATRLGVVVHGLPATAVTRAAGATPAIARAVSPALGWCRLRVLDLAPLACRVRTGVSCTWLVVEALHRPLLLLLLLLVVLAPPLRIAVPPGRRVRWLNQPPSSERPPRTAMG
jgi:hypothetical protein